MFEISKIQVDFYKNLKKKYTKDGRTDTKEIAVPHFLLKMR